MIRTDLRKAGWIAAWCCANAFTCAQTPAGTPAASENKPAAVTTRAIVAKSQDEFKAYQAAITQADLIAADRMATDFASRFPDSDLREPLYQTLMLRHQAANDGDRALADAERVLLLNPQNTVALAAAANVIAERTAPSAPEAQHRFDQGLRYAQRALQAIATGANTANEPASELKSLLSAVAHAAKGNIYLLQKSYAEAEAEFTEAVRLSPKPDPVSMYRLALAQHGQKRLNEALVTADKALQAANAAHDLLLAERAKNEKSVLIRAGARP